MMIEKPDREALMYIIAFVCMWLVTGKSVMLAYILPVIFIRGLIKN